MLVAANIITANMVQVTPQKTVADELNSKLTEGQNYAGVTIDANTGITITDSEGTSTVLDSQRYARRVSNQHCSRQTRRYASVGHARVCA